MGHILAVGIGAAAIAAASVVAAQPSPPSTALAATAAQQTPPDDIPPALYGFTKCMVETAKAAPRVLSATSGVMTQDGKAFVFVRFQYRSSDKYGKYEAVVTYGHLRDASVEKSPIFAAVLPGIYPTCDTDKNGKRNCENVRKWEADRRARGPIPGWGTPEVAAAWRKTCGVTMWSMVA